MVLSVDIKLMDGKYYIFTAAGHVNTGIDAFEHLKRGIDLGAGELVINSIDADGVKNGFDLPLLKGLRHVPRPGYSLRQAGQCAALIDYSRPSLRLTALAASVFHFGEIAIGDLKQTLRENGIDVRI